MGNIDKHRIPGSFDKHLPDFRGGAVTADKAGIADGTGPAAFYRDTNGHWQIENSDTIQAAIDAVPTRDNLGQNSEGSGEGFVRVIGRGDGSGTSDGEYNEELTWDVLGSRLIGSGIHTKVEVSGTNPGLTITADAGDSEVAYWWIDHQGTTGPSVKSVPADVKIKHLNIDHTPDVGLRVEGDNSWIGPDVEIKNGPTEALNAENAAHSRFFSINVEQYRSQDTIDDGYQVGNNQQYTNCDYYGEGTRGFQALSNKSDTRFLNCKARDPREFASTTGPTIGFEIDAPRMFGRLLKTRNCGTAGLRLRNDAEDCDFHGYFPDGVTIESGATRNAIWGYWGSISDSGKWTRKNGVVSDTYTGDGTTGRAIDIGFRPSVVLIEGSNGTVYDLWGDLSLGAFGTDPAGELSITDDGFTVGDNSADADPNTDTETYTVTAW